MIEKITLVKYKTKTTHIVKKVSLAWVYYYCGREVPEYFPPMHYKGVTNSNISKLPEYDIGKIENLCKSCKRNFEK